MVQLIITILALFLVAAVVIASLDLIPVGTELRVQAITKTQEDVDSLRRGVEAYLEDLRDPFTGSITLPEPTNALMDVLAPDYVYRPRGIQGGSWTAGIGERNGRDQIYLCLSPNGSWSSEVRQGLEDAVQTRFPQGAAFLNPQCGATSSSSLGAASLTYWYPPVHSTTDMSGVAIMAPPNPLDAILLDEDRPVRLRLGVEGMVETNFNADPPSMIDVYLEIRDPDEPDAWIVADRWAPTTLVTYDREITASWEGVAVTVVETLNSAHTTLTLAGTLSASIPAGWEYRYRTDNQGTATATASRVVVHRM
jgi:hypothetical protein